MILKAALKTVTDHIECIVMEAVLYMEWKYGTLQHGTRKNKSVKATYTAIGNRWNDDILKHTPTISIRDAFIAVKMDLVNWYNTQYSNRKYIEKVIGISNLKKSVNNKDIQSIIIHIHMIHIKYFIVYDACHHPYYYKSIYWLVNLKYLLKDMV